MIQPIVVRRSTAASATRSSPANAAGARAQLAGLDQVPAVVREVPDEAALAMALIENIQREDLNPLEEARAAAPDRRIRAHPRAGGRRGGASRTATNLLRLLEAGPAVQAMVMDGAIDMGHARALLALEITRQVEGAKRCATGAIGARD